MSNMDKHRVIHLAYHVLARGELPFADIPNDVTSFTSPKGERFKDNTFLVGYTFAASSTERGEGYQS